MCGDTVINNDKKRKNPSTITNANLVLKSKNGNSINCQLRGRIKISKKNKIGIENNHK